MISTEPTPPEWLAHIKPVVMLKDAIRLRGNTADLTVDLSRIPPQDHQLFVQILLGYFPVGITDCRARAGKPKSWWRRLWS